MPTKRPADVIGNAIIATGEETEEFEAGRAGLALVFTAARTRRLSASGARARRLRRKRSVAEHR